MSTLLGQILALRTQLADAAQYMENYDSGYAFDIKQALTTPPPPIVLQSKYDADIKLLNDRCTEHALMHIEASKRDVQANQQLRVENDHLRRQIQDLDAHADLLARRLGQAQRQWHMHYEKSGDDEPENLKTATHMEAVMWREGEALLDAHTKRPLLKAPKPPQTQRSRLNHRKQPQTAPSV